MKKVCFILLISICAIAYSAPQKRQKPDSIKGDTVFHHTVVIDNNRISVDEKAYNNALETAKSTIDSLKWLIGFLILFIGALFTIVKHFDEKRTRQTIGGFEDKLKTAKDELEKKEREIAGLCTKSDLLIPKVEEVITKYNSIEERVKISIETGLSKLDNKINEADERINLLDEKVKTAKLTAETAIKTSNKPEANLSLVEGIKEAENCVLEGENDNAIAVLNKLIKQYQNNKVVLSDLLRRRAEILGVVLKYEEAIADLAISLKLSKDSADGIMSRALIYLHNGKYEESISDCTSVLQSTSNKEHDRIILARSLRAIGYAYIKKTKESLDDINYLSNNFALNNTQLYNIACANALLHKATGDESYKQKAFTTLSILINNKTMAKKFVRNDPDWKHYSDEPFFQNLVK